ncbi:hypothetical protein ACH5RR_039714 [Cinchona calisaya]|uniref:Uncharacterized protein n=1 Tax=Cinchona calisaya TaxID=153742 RepID=A0ABD2Y1K7_9GENT
MMQTRKHKSTLTAIPASITTISLSCLNKPLSSFRRSLLPFPNAYCLVVKWCQQWHTVLVAGTGGLVIFKINSSDAYCLIGKIGSQWQLVVDSNKQAGGRATTLASSCKSMLGRKRREEKKQEQNYKAKTYTKDLLSSMYTIYVGGYSRNQT